MTNVVSNPSPLIVVAIPVYNGEQSLGRVIQSLLNQTYENIKILVVDNASTDQTEKVVRQLKANDTRIIYRRNPNNIGMINNFNKAFYLSVELEPAFFTWASHDDYYDSSFISKCHKEFLRDPGLVVASSWCSAVNQEGEVIFIDRGQNLDEISNISRFYNYRKLLHKDGYVGCLFYGLYNVGELKSVMPMKEMIASDHIHLAELSIKGRFKIVEESLIYKAQGGASKNLESLKKALNLDNSFKQNFPYLYREVIIFKKIMRSETIFYQKITLALISLSVFLKYSILRDPYRKYKHLLKAYLHKLLR